MSERTDTIMTALKQATAPQHDDAENRRLQRDLGRGELPSTTYARWLGQMFLLHRELRDGIDAHREEHPALGDVVRDEGRHVANARQDLAKLGIDADSVEPLRSTARALTEIRDVADDDPLTLLGYNYVLEGSMNGNRFIARAMAPTLAVPAVAYLDPYGEEQRPNWLAYRERMNALDLTDDQGARMVAAAQSMFSFIAEMSEEIMTEQEVPA